MMTSSNGNIFRVTGPLWGVSTGDRRIYLTKASDAELWYFLWSAPEQNAGSLRRHRAHYEVTVMQCHRNRKYHYSLEKIKTIGKQSSFQMKDVLPPAETLATTFMEYDSSTYLVRKGCFKIKMKWKILKNINNISIYHFWTRWEWNAMSFQGTTTHLWHHS